MDALKERRTLGEEEGRMVSSVRGKLGSEKKVCGTAGSVGL